MNILVVGGAGYVGDGITKIFNSDPILKNITVYDNLLYESRFMKNVNFIYGDITDTKKLNSIIHNYDIVIWLAAIVGDGACAVNIEKSNQINYLAVKWLVDNYKGKIIFPSTCSVYGINHNLIDETAEPNPLSVYAQTKLAAEQYILQNSENALVFRLGTLFGISDIYSRIRFDLVANILTLKAVQGEKLSVFGGEQWRPLLHVNDVAFAMAFGIKRNISGLYNLVFNNYRINDIVEEIRYIIPNLNVEYTDMKFEDLRNYRVLGNKFFNLGWVPTYSLKSGLSDIAKIVTENRIKNPYDSIYSNAAYIKELN